MSQLSKHKTVFDVELLKSRILSKTDYNIIVHNAYKYFSINDRLFLINLDTGDEFFMELPYTGHVDEHGNVKKIKSHIKRYEVKLLILKDAFMSLTDPKFITVNVRAKPILFEGYYTNKFTY